eukprot:gene2177-5197_t
MEAILKSLLGADLPEKLIDQLSKCTGKEVANKIDRLYEIVEQTYGTQAKPVRLKSLTIVRRLLSTNPALLLDFQRWCKPKTQAWVFLFILEQANTIKLGENHALFLEHIWPYLWKLHVSTHLEKYRPNHVSMRLTTRPTTVSLSSADKDFFQLFAVLSDSESLMIESACDQLEAAVELLNNENPIIYGLQESDVPIDWRTAFILLSHELAVWHLSRGNRQKAELLARRKHSILEELPSNLQTHIISRDAISDHNGLCAACCLHNEVLPNDITSALALAVATNSRMSADNEKLLETLNQEEFVNNLLTFVAFSNSQKVCQSTTLRRTTNISPCEFFKTYFFSRSHCVRASCSYMAFDIIHKERDRIYKNMSNSPQTDVENVLRNLLVFQEQLTSHQEELQIRLPNSPRCENQHANSCICSDLSSVLSNGNIYSLIQKLEQENISSAITALEKVPSRSWKMNIILELLRILECARSPGNMIGACSYEACTSILMTQLSNSGEICASVCLFFGTLTSYPISHALLSWIIWQTQFDDRLQVELSNSTYSFSEVAPKPSDVYLYYKESLDIQSIQPIFKDYCEQLRKSLPHEKYISYRAKELLISAQLPFKESFESAITALSGLLLLTDTYSNVPENYCKDLLPNLTEILLCRISDRQPFLSCLLTQYVRPVDYLRLHRYITVAFEGQQRSMHIECTKQHWSLIWDSTFQEMMLHFLHQHERKDVDATSIEVTAQPQYISNVDCFLTYGQHFLKTVRIVARMMAF